MHTLIRRTVPLDQNEASGFDRLGKMVDEADVRRDKMAATSFDVAISKFHFARRKTDAYEQLIDLATALEATLLGGDADTAEVTLRLKYRAAALLWCDTDPAQAIFDDVGRLYGLRSRLVHGGDLKSSQLRSMITGISTASDEEAFGISRDRAVDRLRDLVRRAILARMCLAAGDEPLWPFHNQTQVDRALSNPPVAAAWRARWRDDLGQMGVGFAADRARDASEFLAREDALEERGDSTRTKRG